MSGMDEILRIAQQAFPSSKVTSLAGNSLEVLYDTEGNGYVFCTVDNGKSMPEYYGIREFRYLLELSEAFSVGVITNKHEAFLRLRFEKMRVDKANMVSEDFSYVPLTDEEREEISNRPNNQRPAMDFYDGIVPDLRNFNLPELRRVQALADSVSELFDGIPCAVEGPGNTDAEYGDDISVSIIAGYPTESWFTVEFGEKKRRLLLNILDIVDGFSVGIELWPAGYKIAFDFSVDDVRFD